MTIEVQNRKLLTDVLLKGALTNGYQRAEKVLDQEGKFIEVSEVFDLDSDGRILDKSAEACFGKYLVTAKIRNVHGRLKCDEAIVEKAEGTNQNAPQSFHASVFMFRVSTDPPPNYVSPAEKN